MGMRGNGESGQMTVELAIALPVMIIIAVIAYNALAFFGECAAFDRLAQDAVRVYAASPAAGRGADDGCALALESLKRSFGSKANMEVSMAHGAAGANFDEFTATLDYHPTLFGLDLRAEVLGVPLPPMSHRTRIVVDVYKPGVLI